MSIQNSVSRSATAQGLETTEIIDARFDAWDCEQGSVRPWALGRRKCVLSLVRSLANEDRGEMGFSTPMKVTIAPTSLYQPSPSWREWVRGTYQMGVYPNVNLDWGEIEASVVTFEEALDVAEAACADLEADQDLLESEVNGIEPTALPSRGPKPTF